MIKVKLNSAAKIQGDAYMLRRDGEEIWVDVHPYGVITKQSNARECNLLPAVFMARYSRENKSEAIQFINSYLAEVVMNADDSIIDTLDNPDAIRKYLREALTNVPSTFIQVLEWQGVVGDKQRNADALVQYYDPSIFDSYDAAFDVDTRDDGTQLAKALNQEFIRIRTGGRYDSYGDGTYYARIGSSGFNWSKNIKQSVKEHKREVSNVCIERDSESDTGDPFAKDTIYAYKTDSGKDIMNMPVDEFINEPVSLLSSKQYDEKSVYMYIQNQLAKTASIKTLNSARMNPTRLWDTISKLCYNERNGLTAYKVNGKCKNR
jgi:hypothetical protein